MSARARGDVLRIRAARFISQVSAPPLVLLVSGAAICRSQSAPACWRALATYATLSIAVPLIVLLALRLKGRVGDFDLTRRTERAVPLLAATASSLAAWLALRIFAPEAELTMFAALQSLMLALLCLITLWWKISIHAAGVAALAAVIDVRQLPSLVAVLTLLSIVGWSRITLGKHTVGQYVAGGSLSGALFTVWRVL